MLVLILAEWDSDVLHREADQGALPVRRGAAMVPSWQVHATGKLQCFDWRGGQPWRLVASLVPLSTALWIGLTRIEDYWHHWVHIHRLTAACWWPLADTLLCKRWLLCL